MTDAAVEESYNSRAFFIVKPNGIISRTEATKQSKHIYEREAQAFWRAVEFLQEKRRTILFWFTDSKPLYQAFKKGYSSNGEVNKIIQRTARWIHENDIILKPKYLRSEENWIADKLSRIWENEGAINLEYLPFGDWVSEGKETNRGIGNPWKFLKTVGWEIGKRDVNPK
jgi:hypothetical protein